jgi:non-ribosomal peptide synthetase-like protein
MVAFPSLTIVAVKWVLLGRVRPGMHPLWSCWASRWDFVCMAWGFYAEDAVAALEGTLFLSVLLRAMGVRIGRNVVIGGGFAYDLVDPDMLSFEDGATVDCSFQTHTFEDRVLKIDRVKIRSGASVGRNATLLYGADIGARTCVSPHSVVMKYERLLPGRSYVGFPTRPSTSREGPQMARASEETKLRKAATPILATAPGEKE